MEAIALDVHAHIVPIQPTRLAVLPGIEWDGAKLAVDGAPIGLEPASRPEALIAWMDANRVARAWISIPPTLYRLTLDPALARAWARYVNDGLADAAARFPVRLAPLFHLPLQAPEVALEIVVEAAAAGRARFAMPAGAAERGVTLSDLVYAPLWPALDAARAFLFLHPCKGCDPGSIASISTTSSGARARRLWPRRISRCPASLTAIPASQSASPMPAAPQPRLRAGSSAAK